MKSSDYKKVDSFDFFGIYGEAGILAYRFSSLRNRSICFHSASGCYCEKEILGARIGDMI